MAYPDEPAAFDAWVRTAPNNAVLLVDTYDTLAGIEHAIAAGRKLEAAGHHFAGIRIDSGDLAWLSARAREMLDAAGFTSAQIYASNDLDEYTIASLKDQGAPIEVWGVGTRLVTAWDQPSLGGIYKMTAQRENADAAWSPRIKISSAAAKTTTPGIQGLRRYFNGTTPVGDMIYDINTPPAAGPVRMIDPQDFTCQKEFDASLHTEELLVDVFCGGRLVYELPELRAIQARTLAGLATLDASHKRLLNPHRYPVGLEESLYATHVALMKELKGL
jgi:nicotinate phosphoribosyltransferase